MNDPQFERYHHEFHGPPDRLPTSAPWNLAALDDQARARILTDLGAWVAWLIQRYALADLIPDCWAKHPALLEELLALKLAWRNAYQLPDAPAAAPLAWHESFALARQRLRDWNRWGCAAGSHRPEPAQPVPTASRT